MPVGKLNRDIAFFQDLRDNNSLINASDFDDQFNQLIDFINNEMLPVVNAIAGDALPGIEGSENTFLHNIGDGNTDFVHINNDAIPDFVLEFSKLVKSVNSGAILAAANDGEFVEVDTNLGDRVLISVINDVPIWDKITTNCIEDRTITTGKIALNTIRADNIVPGTLINNLANNSVIGNYFSNSSIPNSKIARNSLEIRNFGVIWPGGINTAVFTGRIGSRHVALGTLSGEKINTVLTDNFNLVKCITPGKIAPQNIIEDRLELHTWTDVPITGRNALGHFPSLALSPNFKLTTQELPLNSMIKTWFEPTVEQAFTDHGCF